MIRRERDSQFVIYQVLYIFVITVLALKGADLDLRRVALEDETVRVSVRDSLMSVLDSLYSLGIDFSIKIDPNVVVENEEMKKQLAEMNRKLEAVKDYVPPPKEEEKPKELPKEEQLKMQLPISTKQTFIQYTWNTAKNSGTVPTSILDRRDRKSLAVIPAGQEIKFDFGFSRERAPVRTSYRGYRRWGLLFRPLFASFGGVGAQSEEDAARLRSLGCRPGAVHVVGSLKFDAAQLDERRDVDVPALLDQLGVPPGAPVLVGGSTHAGEEILLAQQFLGLRTRHPGLFQILVPRHFERSREVARELQSLGLRVAYRSEVGAGTRLTPGAVDCLLVNTTGELRFFYEHATIVFVGKSLTAHGGQNPSEPGSLGKALVFGPNMGVMAGDLWFVRQDGNPTQDNTSTFR